MGKCQQQDHFPLFIHLVELQYVFMCLFLGQLSVDFRDTLCVRARQGGLSWSKEEGNKGFCDEKCHVTQADIVEVRSQGKVI